MTITQRPDNRVQLTECVGVHIRPGTPTEHLEWQPPYGTLRIWAHTCQRCDRVSYELGSLGGAYVIRRTDHTRLLNPEVRQTAPVHYALARQWWDLLLYGCAA